MSSESDNTNRYRSAGVKLLFALVDMVVVYSELRFPSSSLEWNRTVNACLVYRNLSGICLMNQPIISFYVHRMLSDPTMRNGNRIP